MHHHRRQRGYTLLFAVLTATVVLGVAVFILNVSRKQFLLSSTARDSMFALYAADSGIECVSADDALLATTSGNTHAISCDGKSITPQFQADPTYTDPGGTVHADAYQTLPNALNFGFTYKDPSGSGSSPANGCVDVTVTKYMDTSNPTTVDTDVAADGYNFCTAANTPDTTNARTVDRGLVLSQ